MERLRPQATFSFAEETFFQINFLGAAEELH
uniref:Uncharacterized protein n=1 Tax=Anguilla anguilla TaxID=7936 RepID=A0A0E9R775_ANGAN